MSSDKVYRVIESDKYVKHVAEYINGILTTSGFYNKNELEEVFLPVFGIAYDSLSCTELPIEWHSKQWIDDRNECHRIISIDFGSMGEREAYMMDDGYKSWEVIG